MIAVQDQEKSCLVRDDFGGHLDLASNGRVWGLLPIPKDRPHLSRCFTKRLVGHNELSLHARVQHTAGNGVEVVPSGPKRPDPALETAPEKHGIDAIDQFAQPALAGNAVMQRRELSQKIQLMFVPGDDLVEIVA
jgi:hypothetical protein